LGLSELTTDICVVKGYLLTQNNKSFKISEGTPDTAVNYPLLFSGILQVTIAYLLEVAYSASRMVEERGCIGSWWGNGREEAIGET